jgi:hypothetical protein
METPAQDLSIRNNSRDNNELTKIRGIGTTRKQWLNALGIYTIADLAQFSADDIEFRLKSEGRSLPQSELEEWIIQAQAQTETLASPSDSSLHNGSPSKGSVRANNVQDHNMSDHDVSDRCANTIKVKADNAIAWNSLASFRIDYQTRQAEGRSEQQTTIHYLDTGTTAQWTGFDTSHIQPWIQEQIEETFSQAKPENLGIPEITQLRIIQPPHSEQSLIADKTYPMFSSAIRSDELFVLEVSLQFPGLVPTDFSQFISYQVRCIAHEVATGTMVNLGEISAQVPLSDRSIYRVWLSELIFPHPGIYRLKISATLQNKLATSGYFKVPMLQVV